MNQRGLFAVIAVIFLSLGALPASAQKWGEVTTEEWGLQAPADFPESNAAVLFDIGKLIVTTDGISFARHVRMKVFTNAGADEVGDVSVEYRDDDKLKGLKAQTITPDGQKHEVDRSAFYSKLYGSTQEKTFAFPAVEPGSILEYRYELVNERFVSLDPWYFQSDLFTMKSSFTLVLAPGFTYSSLAKNIPRSEQEAVIEDNMATKDRSFTWTRNNLPPVTDEPYMSATSDYLSSLYCQLAQYVGTYQTQNFIRGWPDLGEGYSDMVLGYTRKDGGLKEVLATVIDPNAPKQENNARAIYNFVTRNYKGKSDGGWFTHENLKTLLVEKYGTTREKNLLLTEMLRRAGIDAWPVMISTRDHGVFKPELYQATQFNHLIVYAVIDSIGTFMDASSRFCPYGSLPSNSMTNGGLLLDGKNSELVRVFTNIPTCLRVDVTNISIDTVGQAHCSTAVGFTGYFTSVYGNLYEQEEPEDFVKDRFVEKVSDDYDLGEYSFDYDTTTNQCKLSVAYVARDLTEELDQNILISPVDYYLKSNPFTLKRRDFPIDFGFPFTYQRIVNIHCGGNAALGQMPADTSFQILGASYRRHVSRAGNDVKVECKLIVETPTFSPVDYQQVRQFFTSIEDVSQQQVVFMRTAE